jgi:hypothetical protein
MVYSSPNMAATMHTSIRKVMMVFTPFLYPNFYTFEMKPLRNYGEELFINALLSRHHHPGR